MIPDQSQATAIQAIASTNNLSVLTGGPGFGKTFTIQNLLERLWSVSIIKPEKTFLACPTGKAAKVLEDSLYLLDVENPPATIHRMLGCQGPTWIHNEKNPLEADCVIIDEASMVDSALLARVIFSITKGCRIILVGDKDQLPPVAAGNPFHDIVASGKNVNRLEINHRQAEGSLIADACSKIIVGEKPTFGHPGEYTLGGTREDDLFHVKEDDKDEIPEKIAAIVAPWHKDILDYCVLAPQRTGPCGVENLNKYLQEVLNPPEEFKTEAKIFPWLTLRTGDKVLHTKNNYGLGVFNGFTGVVKYIDDVSGDVWVNYDGQEVIYSEKKDLQQLTLGYCLTVHKSQGSQYKHGVLACHSTHYYMWSRELLYTAVSRFKEELHVVGDKRGLQRAVSNSTENKRNTYIDLALRGEASGI